MKTLDTWDALQMAFEYHKKNSITIAELNEWNDMYAEKHPEIYSYISRLDIMHEHECNRVWFQFNIDGPDFIHKQESILCTTCGTTHYKYPNIEVYEKIVEMLSHVKKLEELWNSK